MNTKKAIPVILGPTASGKTKLAVHLAHDTNAEIISADSRQVYKQMDIGTGKDLGEYFVKDSPIKHHLIDIHEAGYKYNINLYYNDFIAALNAIEGNGKTPILCGGSGLYLQTALEGNIFSGIPVNDDLRTAYQDLAKTELQILFEKELSAELKQKLDQSSRKRLIRALEINAFLKNNTPPAVTPHNYQPIIFGIDISREQRRENISKRLKQRFEEGMLDEVKTLLKTVSAEALKYYGLEYLFITEHIEGKYSYEKMFNLLEIAIHQFSKRQMTWFRRMEKQGYVINWLDYNLPLNDKVTQIKSILKR